MKRKRLFGIDSSCPFCLKNRLFAKLVERLSAMTFAQDEQDKDFYKFISETGDSADIFVKITSEQGEKGGHIVELFDEKKFLLLREEIAGAGHPLTYHHHPLYELIELIKGHSPEEIEQIREINNVLSML